jgi:hypothetical protein
MERKRPLGVTILGILFIIGGALSVLSVSFYFIKGLKGGPQFNVERYREFIFKNRQPTQEEIKEFEESVPRIEKMFQAQNEAAGNPYIRAFKIWNLIMGAIGFVLGIGLLRLKEKARRWTIVFQVVAAVIGSIGGYVSMKIAFDTMVKHMPDAFPEEMSRRFVVPGMTVFQVLILGIIAAAVIFYLTRSKVKEQFLQ